MNSKSSRRSFLQRLRFEMAAAALFVCTSALAAPAFEGKDTLLLPKNYREWIFVGSSMGLQYDASVPKEPSPDLEFKNVYIDPVAFKEFSTTGKFPQGTVLVLEIASGAAKKEPGLQGTFQKEFVGLLAAVKDEKRFAEGWAYFRFTDKPGSLKNQAQPFPKAACYDCHRQKAETDHVFTQFYPVLRAVAKK